MPNLLIFKRICQQNVHHLEKYEAKQELHNSSEKKRLSITMWRLQLLVKPNLPILNLFLTIRFIPPSRKPSRRSGMDEWIFWAEVRPDST